MATSKQATKQPAQQPPAAAKEAAEKKAIAEQMAKEAAEKKALLEMAAKEAAIQKLVQETPATEPAAKQAAEEQTESKRSTLDELLDQPRSESPPWMQSPDEETEEEEEEQETAEPTDATKQDAGQPTDATKQDAGQPSGAVTKSQWSEDAEKIFTRIEEQLRTGQKAREAGKRSHLKSWHVMGEILSSPLGPKGRHEYGMKIVVEAARRFKISESELYKAAKFYRLQPDFDAFCAANPKLNTWSAVKSWLPGEGSGDTEEQQTRRKHQGLVKRGKHVLKDLRDAINAGFKANVAEADRRDLTAEMQETLQLLAPPAPDKPASDEPAEEPTT